MISARNTWTLYELNTLTGQVLLRIGGKHSEVKLASGTATAFQHDATMLGNGTISIFDNGGVPKVQPQSLGLVVSVNPATKTDTLVAQFAHPSSTVLRQPGRHPAAGQWRHVRRLGRRALLLRVQRLGAALLFDGHMHGSYESYRTYRFPWVGTPSTAPAIAAVGANAEVTVYASWNGATQVTSWRVFAGPSPNALDTGGHGRRRGLRDRDHHTRARALRRGAGARSIRRGDRHLQDDQGLEGTLYRINN